MAVSSIIVWLTFLNALWGWRCRRHLAAALLWQVATVVMRDRFCRRREVGLIALSEELLITDTELGVIGIEDVVGKKDVGDLVAAHIFHHVFGEITGIDNMHFLKRKEKITRQGIAKTVFQYQHPTTIMRRGNHLGDLGVSTHESAIGSAVSILVVVEELALESLAHARDVIVFVDGIWRIIRVILHPIGLVIDKILRSILDGHVLGIGIHASHIAMHHLSGVAVQILERHFGHTGKFLGGIKCAQWCPMMVSAQIDVFVGMFAQCGIYIHSQHTTIEL